MIDDENKTTYSTSGVVRHYAQLRRLQPAEQTILSLLKHSLSQMKMLDIGVGGGRTTQHFHPLVSDYIGIDYSSDMILACQKRFAQASPPIAFDVCDARDMSRFEDHSFDFILFSFSGIDSLSHADRLQVLTEIHRIGRPGGFFCFSSHNLQGIERAFNWRSQLSLNPLKTYVDLVMMVILRCFNRAITPAQLKDSAYAIIQDESHNFRLQTYYIRPQNQMEQLEGNFDDIKIYSWKSGLEITRACDLKANTDLWLYYLCRIK